MSSLKNAMNAHVTNTQSQNEPVPSSNFVSLNPNFQAETITPCPACQQMSLESAFQPSLTPTGTGYTLMHCVNPECDGYALTLRQETFLQQMQETRQAMTAKGANSDVD